MKLSKDVPISLIFIVGLFSIFSISTVNAASHIFTIEYNGTAYSYGSGPDPLVTDINSGGDITYILTAAGNDYWETTREFWHFAFINMDTSASGGVTSTGAVSYSLDGGLVGQSAPNTLVENAGGLAGSTFTLTHPTQFDTITITSHIDSTEFVAPFQINNYQVTELDLDWVSYQQDTITTQPIRLLEDWNTTPALDNGWGNSYDNDFQVYISAGELHHVLRPYSTAGTSSQVQTRSRFVTSTANNMTAFQSTVRI